MTDTTAPYHIFLDDERMPRQVTWVQLPLVQWTIVRSYPSFVSLIELRGLPAFITFDHDLGQEHYDDIAEAVARGSLGHRIDYASFKTKTGYHAAQWLVTYCMDRSLPLPPYAVHSMNPVGRANIESLLAGFKASQEDHP